MAQVLTDGTRSDSSSTGKIVNIVLWVLQIAAAGMFLMVGFLKLSGNPQLVGLFEAIGIGQWFRYLTGTLEVAGALLLFFPPLCGFAAVGVRGGVGCAGLMRLLIVRGRALGGIILLVVTSLVAWGRRRRTINLLTGRSS